MQAFHSLWTKPFFARHPGNTFSMSAADVLTMALSALSFQALGGTIQMHTDNIGEAYLSPLSFLWNGGIITSLQSIPSMIDPYLFWAAGKLYALRKCPAPVIMMDTDFILWESVESELSGQALVAIHAEALTSAVYPDTVFENNTQLAALSRTVPPLNTAFCYFGDNVLRAQYTHIACSYMALGNHMQDALTDMVFAEQRLLPMCAAARGVQPHTLSSLKTLFDPTQNKRFTHVWGYKQRLRQSHDENAAFCTRCALRLTRDFPTAAQALAAFPVTAPYFATLQ